MLVALMIAAALAAGQTPPPSDSNRPPTPEEIDALQQLYDSSCGSRGYGEYDDVCILITKQLNEAKDAADKAQRAKPKAKPPAPAGSQPDPKPASGPTA